MVEQVTDQPLISLIIPCWNEEETVAIFYAETIAVVATMEADFEFIFIDDGSTDATYRKLKELCRADKRLRVLRMSRNFGSFAAVAAGFNACTGDAAICIPADLQDPPSLIPQLFNQWRDGVEIVWAAIDKRNDPFISRFVSGCFYKLIRKIAFENLPLNGMNISLFSRRVIDVYCALPERDSIPIFTIFNLGFHQAEVPYVRATRIAGSSGWSFWRRVRSAIDIIVTFSYVPIRLIGLIGISTALIGFIYAFTVLIEFFFFGIAVSGWSSLMLVLLATSSIQLLILGVIAEYLWRQGRQVRQEPRYIIMDECGVKQRAIPPSLVSDVDHINVSFHKTKPGSATH
jgi:glycosyltransferase involved in cell wall biosynthesis